MRFERNNPFYDRSFQNLLDTGLTHEPFEDIVLNDEPKIPMYVCHPKRYATADKHDIADCAGGGFAPSHSLARLKSVAETIERTALYHPQLEIVHGAYQDFSSASDPASLVNFSSNQLEGSMEEYLNMVRNAQLSWVEGYDHNKNRSILIPVQAAVLSGDVSKEPILREQNTNGAAFGMSRAEAISRGLLELVERDSFLLTYLNQTPPPRIDTRDSEDLDKLEHYLRRYRLELNVFDITTDIGIPTGMAVTIDRTNIGPAVTLGASADLDLGSAAIKAAYESLLGRNFYRIEKVYNKQTLLESSEIGGARERWQYWSDMSMIKHIEPIMSSEEVSSIPKSTNNLVSEEKLDRVLSSLRERKFEIFSVNLSFPELENLGTSVVKTVVPELHPLYLSEKYKAMYSVHGGEISELDIPPHPFL